MKRLGGELLGPTSDAVTTAAGIFTATEGRNLANSDLLVNLQRANFENLLANVGVVVMVVGLALLAEDYMRHFIKTRAPQK